MLERLERDRWQLLSLVTGLVEDHLDRLRDRRVVPVLSPEEIRDRLSGYDFAAPLDPEMVLRDCMDILSEWTVHTGHPRYFGLFNPAPTLMGILGDTLAATANPQLAVWSHAPGANEIERHLLRFIGVRLGLDADHIAGSFATGGAEANLTAVLLALTRTFPGYADGGVRALSGDPVFYASAESHLAWLKIAHVAGIGRDSVRLVPVAEDLRMDVNELHRQVERDRRDGRLPFLVVATAGTTGGGAIDPLPETADACETLGLRLHVDAAWGGAVVLSDRLRPLLAGIDRAHSVTVDAHKWMSVPMGAGMFLCTDEEGLFRTFRVSTLFMPSTTPGTIDPYVHSIQWSRRFVGLKLFLTVAVAGRSGYAEQIERDCSLGDVLRRELQDEGWNVLNDTPLPVVCFVDPAPPERRADDFNRRVAEFLVERGTAWISTTPVHGKSSLRACITSFRTGRADVKELVGHLDVARREVRGEFG
jgi:aromatic-L-amino-acid decarboxylase